MIKTILFFLGARAVAHFGVGQLITLSPLLTPHSVLIGVGAEQR
jgi:hypothetical protein